MNTVILNPMPAGIQGDTLRDKFTKVGGNPGNMVFFESTKDQLKFSDVIDIQGRLSENSPVNE